MSGTDFEYAIKKDVRNNPIVREVDEARQRQLWRSTAIGAVLVVVLLFSVWQRVRAVAPRLRDGAAAAGPRGGGRGEPAPPARDRDAAIAAADRGHRDEEAASRRARPRSGHRHRAGHGASAARQVHRRCALARQGRHVRRNRGRRSRQTIQASLDPNQRAIPAAADGGPERLARHDALAARGRRRRVRAVDRRHRSAPRLPSGGRAHRHADAAPTGSRCACSRRRPNAARSSIAPAACSPTASTPTRSLPIRPTSRIPTRSRPRSAGRSTTATPRIGRRWRGACAATRSSPTSRAKCPPTRRSACGRWT